MGRVPVRPWVVPTACQTPNAFIVPTADGQGRLWSQLENRGTAAILHACMSPAASAIGFYELGIDMG